MFYAFVNVLFITLLLQIKMQWQILWKSSQREYLRFKMHSLHFVQSICTIKKQGKELQIYNLKCHPGTARMNSRQRIIIFSNLYFKGTIETSNVMYIQWFRIDSKWTACETQYPPLRSECIRCLHSSLYVLNNVRLKQFLKIISVKMISF